MALFDQTEQQIFGFLKFKGIDPAQKTIHSARSREELPGGDVADRQGDKIFEINKKLVIRVSPRPVSLPGTEKLQ